MLLYLIDYGCLNQMKTLDNIEKRNTFPKFQNTNVLISLQKSLLSCKNYPTLTILEQKKQLSTFLQFKLQNIKKKSTMLFKLYLSFLYFYFSLLIATQQTCWITRQNKLIIQQQITTTSKYQFSVHPTSGAILSKQFRDKSKQTIFFGDFGMLRAYNKQLVTIFEGLYMKLMPLTNQISSWTKPKYQNHNIMQLQIVFNYAFGNRQIIPYEEIGMSFYIAAINTSNETIKKKSSKFTKQMIDLQKGKKLKMEQYFYVPSMNIANNMYIYRAQRQLLERIFPLSSDNQKVCSHMLWSLQRNVLQIDFEDFQQLRAKFNIIPLIEQRKEPKKLKVYSAKLRNNNKKQKNIERNHGQKIQKKQDQKQSDSCQQL